MNKVLLFAIIAMVVAVFAAGCNGPAPKENKMAIFRCVSEKYYKDAGFYEIPVDQLAQLVESSDDDIDCFVYDSLGNYWVKLYKDSLSRTGGFSRPYVSTWPKGQKYGVIFYPHNGDISKYPHNGDISKITFLFNTENGIEPTLFDCSLGVKNEEFWICSDNLKIINSKLSRSLSVASDGPLMRIDTALRMELGIE